MLKVADPPEKYTPVKLQAKVFMVRDLNVILDSDLAAVFGEETKRLNERVKRNADRFGSRYAFQLTKEETETLKSQIATSKKGRGGRTSRPWVFTEYGVVMAASVLSSDEAIKASKLVVEVFVEVNRRMAAAGNSSKALVPQKAEGALQPSGGPFKPLSGFWEEMGPRLQATLSNVLDTVIDKENRSTVRDEAQSFISESIQSLKDRLKKSGLENEEIAARVTKLLAEAEKEKSIAAKTKAETEALEFQTIVRKLRLLIEVHHAMVENRVDSFLNVLKELDGTKV
jgi:hypothetical protein